jgi:hypothetical protein
MQVAASSAQNLAILKYTYDMTVPAGERRNDTPS